MDNSNTVIRAKEGDIAAYANLVRNFERLAVMRAWNIVGDFHLAQDIAQEAFVIAFRKLHELRSPDAFSGWLSTIVRREAIRMDRKRKSSPEHNSDSLEEQPDTKLTGPDWFERHAAIVNAIQSLPDHEQDVIVLLYLEDRSTNEIASMLDRPIGTVTKQISRAIKRLQSILVEVRDESA